MTCFTKNGEETMKPGQLSTNGKVATNPKTVATVFNPSNAEGTFAQSTRTHNLWNLS